MSHGLELACMDVLRCTIRGASSDGVRKSNTCDVSYLSGSFVQPGPIEIII